MTRAAASCGLDTVWVGERGGSSSPTRLAALAAATSGVTLGMGLVPLSARGADQLEETMTTLAMLASGRVALAFSLPTALAAPVHPAWVTRLPEASGLVRRAGIPVAVAVADRGTALLAAEHVDRVVLRGADPDLTAQVVDALADAPHRPQVEVWLDLACGRREEVLLRSVVAERLGVPGIPGHDTARHIAKKAFAGILGDIDSAYATGQPDAAAEVLPQEMVDRTCLTGDPDRMTDRLREYAAAGASGVTVMPHAATLPERIAAVEAFAAAIVPNPGTGPQALG